MAFLYLKRGLDAVGRKFCLEIVSLLIEQNQAAGFNFFLKNIPKINPKSLSTRLKELEREGIVTKQITVGVPIKIEYRLTEKGLSLKSALQSVDNWGKKFCK